jgi:hypothetical protein
MPGQTKEEAIAERFGEKSTPKQAVSLKSLKSDDLYKGLPKEQQDALVDYVGYSGGLNQDLRSGKVTEHEEREAKLLDSAIDNSPPLKEDVTLYRYVENDIVADLKAGDFYEDKAFVSTTTSHGLPTISESLDEAGLDPADYTVIGLKIPGGTKVLPTNGTWNTYFQGQKEVLLPRGKKWEVVSTASVSDEQAKRELGIGNKGEEEGYWFTTDTGAKVHVGPGQSKEDAMKERFGEEDK